MISLSSKENETTVVVTGHPMSKLITAKATCADAVQAGASTLHIRTEEGNSTK